MKSINKKKEKLTSEEKLGGFLLARDELIRPKEKLL